MTLQTQERRSHGFAIGLLTGTFVGAGLALWFAPRLASELGERIADSAKDLGLQASKQYEQANSRVGEAVSELARKGQDVRDDGDLALEQSLALYERGVQLSRFCHAQLEQAERRIEILNERGELKPAPASFGADDAERG
jgi:exodeoxyribonuclease VII small subunit